ncbi:MAG: acid phosphatase [Candidatus Eremiobacteraeota bacterium]|nr:acid phosphatase [Candidatus Eremiobacteraeota bacterium]MBC5826957.1 acid phosphatase [Candidatus Eremiobacteraeota bacterium]
MENHSYGQIIGNKAARYQNLLADSYALMTDSHAVSHPSLPNYLALFSGSTQGMTSDACPVTFPSLSLADDLLDSGYGFRAYAQNLPFAGDTICRASAGLYTRNHVPSIMFSDISKMRTMPYTQMAVDLANDRYPALAFISPNLCDDMHNCPIGTADAWLALNLAPIIRYDAANNGLLILTYDESLDSDPANHIATILVGPMVKNVRSSQNINHYNVLRTIEQMAGVAYLGRSSQATAISGIWK